jgi:cardiolipin synthase
MIMTLANDITIARILLIAPFVICMIKIHQTAPNPAMRYAAIALFIVMCISDVLDGYFARVRKQATSLGAFLDPLADKLLMTCSCVLLSVPKTAINGFTLPPTVVVLIIGKDILLLLGFIVMHLITSHVHVEPITAGKAGAFCQLSMVAAILIAPDIFPHFPQWIWVMRFFWWSAAVLAVIVTLVYIRGGIRYIDEFEEKTKSNS